MNMENDKDKLLKFGDYKVYESMLRDGDISGTEKYKVYPYDNRFIITDKGRCYDLERFRYLRTYYSPKYDGIKGPYCYFGNYTDDISRRKKQQVYVMDAVIDTWLPTNGKLYRIDGNPMNNSVDNFTADEAIGKAAYAKFVQKAQREYETEKQKEEATTHTDEEFRKLHDNLNCAVKDITNMMGFIKQKGLFDEYKTFIGILNELSRPDDDLDSTYDKKTATTSSK